MHISVSAAFSVMVPILYWYARMHSIYCVVIPINNPITGATLRSWINQNFDDLKINFYVF